MAQIPGADIIDPTSDSGRVFYQNFQRIKDIAPPTSPDFDTLAIKRAIVGAIETAIFIFKFTDNYNPQHGTIGFYLRAIRDQNIYINYGVGNIIVDTKVMPYSTFITNITGPYRRQMADNITLALYLGVADGSVVRTPEESAIYPPVAESAGNATGSVFV